MKSLLALPVILLLVACEQTIVADACDKTKDASLRYGARETAAREGLYVKCVEPDHGWDEYVLMRDGEEVDEVLR